MELSDIKNEQFRNRLAALFSKNARLQAKAAFYTANSNRGYDITLNFIPDERLDEITELIKKGKQVGLININNGYIQAMATELMFNISVCMAETVAFAAIKEAKERGIKTGIDEIIRSKNGLEGVAQLYETNENGDIIYNSNVNKYIKTIEAEYYKNTSHINAFIQIFGGVTKWKYFGCFVEKDIKDNLKAMKANLKEYADCVKRFVSILEQCANENETHFERWNCDFVEPEKIEPDKAVIMEWKTFLEDNSTVF